MRRTTSLVKSGSSSRKGQDGNERLLVLTGEEARTFIGDCIRHQLAAVEDSREPHREKAWFTNAEACQYLGVSRSTMARLRASGTVPYSKLGANVYYALADIESALAARKNG